MNRRRILLLESSSKIAGGQKTLLLHAKYLNNQRFRPIVFCLRNSCFYNLLKQTRISTSEFYIVPQWSNRGINAIILFLNLFIVMPQLVRVVHREKIQLVHSNRPDMHIPAIITAKLAGIPVVIHDHLYLKSTKHRITDFICGLFSDRIISVSEAMRDKLKIPSFCLKKVVVVYNGIVLSDPIESISEHSLKAEFGIGEGQFIIGTLTRISPEKGLEYLVEAFHQTKNEHPGIKLIIAGDIYSESDRKYKVRILNLIKKFDLEKDIIMAGYRTDVADLIQVFDVSVSSSLAESFGMFILESMAMGKAVVATKVGGVPELVIDGETGVLVEPKAVASLADAISRLLIDEKKRLQMGENGKARALRCFSLESTTRQIENIYDELLKGYK